MCCKENQTQMLHNKQQLMLFKEMSQVNDALNIGLNKLLIMGAFHLL